MACRWQLEPASVFARQRQAFLPGCPLNPHELAGSMSHTSRDFKVDRPRRQRYTCQDYPHGSDNALGQTLRPLAKTSSAGGLICQRQIVGRSNGVGVGFYAVGSRLDIGRTSGLKLPAHRRALYSTGGLLSTPIRDFQTVPQSESRINGNFVTV